MHPMPNKVTTLIKFLAKNKGHQLLLLPRIERKFPVTIELDTRSIASDGTEDEEVKSMRSLKLHDLEAKVQDLEQVTLCLICMERRKNVAFLCGHGTCLQCAETLSCCHMCRGSVAQKINLY